MSRKIAECEVLFHGIDGAQYFPGCGVAFTEFTDCATGAGDTAAEALEDALEQLAMGGWDTNHEDITAAEKYAKASTSSASALARENADFQYHVKHAGHCGMVLIDDVYSDKDEAQDAARDRVAAMEKGGYEVIELETDRKWEVLEPEGVALVPDEVGLIWISDNEEEVEEALQESELYWYVSVRVKGEGNGD